MMNNGFPYENYIKHQKNIEFHNLRKASNGLGFFIFSYIAFMHAASYLLMFIGVIFLGFSKDDFMNPGINLYLFDIFVSVFPVLLSSLLYFLFSKRDITETIQVKSVRLSNLVPLVLMGTAVCMVANLATNIVAQNFSLFGIENTVVFDHSSASTVENIIYAIAVSVVPAFAEEFAFRGVLMGTLRKFGDSFAIIASAVIFGCMHGNIVQIPFAFILGLFLAYVDCKTNSIIPSITIHFINNLYAVLLDIFQAQLNLSDSKISVISLYIMALFCLFGVISFIYIAKKKPNFFTLNSSHDAKGTTSLLSLKEKNKAFFLSAGVILSLSVFLIEIICSTNF